jgi:hypothetical protein
MSEIGKGRRGREYGLRIAILNQRRLVTLTSIVTLRVDWFRSQYESDNA